MRNSNISLVEIFIGHAHHQMSGKFDKYTMEAKQLASDLDWLESGIIALPPETYAICQKFLDMWIDEVNHSFANYNGIPKYLWPKLALKIADDLQKFGEIRDKAVRSIFLAGESLKIRDELIQDLELLANGVIDCSSFRYKYVDGPEAFDLNLATVGELPDITPIMEHYLVDEDLRLKDSEYKMMQDKELRKLINLLKTGASKKKIQEIYFLSDSSETATSSKFFGIFLFLLVLFLILLRFELFH